MAGDRSEAALFFNEVHAVDDGRVVFGGHFYIFEGTDSEVTRVAIWLGEDKWARVGDVDAIVPSLCTYPLPDKKLALAALGRDGTFVLFQGKDRRELTIPKDPGFLFQICLVGRSLFACGSQRQVWRFDGRAWARFDEGLVTPRTRARNPVLHGIHGLSESHLYAVGRAGEIALFDGKSWRLVDSPTNQSLERVLCVSKSEVYICGNSGLVYRGSEDTWESIGPKGYSENFWGLTRFKDDIYVCSTPDLFRYDGTEMKRVDTGLKGAIFSRLSANSEYLWATTGKDILYRFDGKKWTVQTWPDNR